MAEEYDLQDQTSGIRGFFDRLLNDTLDDKCYFKLEQETITALDILPKLNAEGLPDNSALGGTSRSDANVYAVLNKCRTTSGKRLLIKWLQNPLKVQDKIQTRLDIVKHIAADAQFRSDCDQYLRKSGDLMRLAFKVHREKASLSELMGIYKACKAIDNIGPSVKHHIACYDKEPTPAFTRLIEWIQHTCDALDEFKKVLENGVDMDNTDESGDLMVKPDSNEEIAKISIEINALCGQAKRVLNEAAKDLDLDAEKTVKLEIDGQRGFALKVTKIHEKSVREVKGYEQLSLVKKDGYRFTNRELTKLSGKYVSAKEEYNLLAKNIIEDIIKEACMSDTEVQEFAMAVSMLDVFVSLAIVADQNNYVCPLVMDSGAGKLVLEKLRHPCIENQPDIENYVPNDITMSKSDKKFFIITGPNMGGKSTFIKSVAVGIVMAQCGSFVPADDARISVIDGIYTRVGAGDRQMEGLSTFMEEMLDMSTILKTATENSLVVIDELGRGTSTFDGFGLAWSMSMHLAKEIKCFTLFATHFHELTELEEEVASVGNLHVKAICDADKLIMLYNVCDGVCDESYGINVARYTQFPEHVIEAAKEKLKQFEEVPGFKDKKEVREFVRDCIREYRLIKSD